MDSLIFELQIVFYFQLFLSANVRHGFLPLPDLSRKIEGDSVRRVSLSVHAGTC